MAQDVFICYSDADRQTAEAVCATLEAGGISCWIAPRNISVGGNWSEAIMDAISGSRVMVVIWSASASASPYVTLEVKHACTQGVTVILFRVENVKPPKDLNFFLAFVQWLDAWTPPLEGHYQRLAETVKSRLSADAEAPNLWVNGDRPLLQEPEAVGRKRWKRLSLPVVAVMLLLLLGSGYYALAWWPGLGRQYLEPNRFQNQKTELNGSDADRSQLTAIPAASRNMPPYDKQKIDTKDGKISVEILNKTVLVIYHNDTGAVITKNCGCRVKMPEFSPAPTENMLKLICESGDMYLYDMKTGKLLREKIPHI